MSTASTSKIAKKRKSTDAKSKSEQPAPSKKQKIEEVKADDKKGKEEKTVVKPKPKSVSNEVTGVCSGPECDNKLKDCKDTRACPKCDLRLCCHDCFQGHLTTDHPEDLASFCVSCGAEESDTNPLEPCSQRCVHTDLESEPIFDSDGKLIRVYFCVNSKHDCAEEHECDEDNVEGKGEKMGKVVDKHGIVKHPTSVKGSEKSGKCVYSKCENKHEGNTDVNDEQQCFKCDLFACSEQCKMKHVLEAHGSDLKGFCNSCAFYFAHDATAGDDSTDCGYHCFWYDEGSNLLMDAKGDPQRAMFCNDMCTTTHEHDEEAEPDSSKEDSDDDDDEEKTKSYADKDKETVMFHKARLTTKCSVCAQPLNKDAVMGGFCRICAIDDLSHCVNEEAFGEDFNIDVPRGDDVVLLCSKQCALKHCADKHYGYDKLTSSA